MTGAGPADPNDPFGQTRPQHPQPGAGQPGPVPPGQNPAQPDQSQPDQPQPGQPQPGPPQQNPPTRTFDPIEGEQYPYSVPIPAADDYYGSQSAYGQDQTYGYGTAYSQQQPDAAAAGPAGPPPNRPRTGRWIAIALAIVVALAVIIGAVVFATKGNDKSSSSAASSTTASSPMTTPTSTTTSSSAPSSSNPNGPEVTYEVTGGPLIVTYFGDGGLRTVAAPPSPWTMTVTLRNGFASVTAISKGSPVTCTIKRGDTVLTTQTSAAIAFCTASGVGN
jgi:hypothetical protein